VLHRVLLSILESITMNEREFEQIVEDEWKRIPLKFARKVENVALLIEDEPDETVRAEEKLTEGDTLLGLYRGIPVTERGSEYGIGVSLPDTITLYRLPILMDAEEMDREFRAAVRIVVRETLWHEIGHYFGFDEHEVNDREDEGTNAFSQT